MKDKLKDKIFKAVEEYGNGVDFQGMEKGFDKCLVKLEKLFIEAYKDGYENGVMDLADNINKARKMGRKEAKRKIIRRK